MKPQSDQLAQLGMLLAARKAERSLRDEPNEKIALAKAVLFLAAFSQENQSPAAKEFLRYVLTSFEPLRAQLDHYNLQVWEGGRVGIRAESNGDPVVVLNRDTVEALFGEFVEADEATRSMVLRQNPVSGTSERPWLTTRPRFVGLFDVMGFSAMVRSAGERHEALNRTMRDLHDAARTAEKFAGSGDDRITQFAVASVASGQIKVVQFSDSIIVFTEDGESPAGMLIQMAAQLLFNRALQNGVILRGAIARGTVTADFQRSIFFGVPIVDAYRLGQAQQWYGIAIHPTAELGGPNDLAATTSNDIPLTEEWPVELKNERVPQKLSVINWPVFAPKLGDIRRLLKGFNGAGSPEEKKLSQYHRRTLDFAETTWRKYHR